MIEIGRLVTKTKGHEKGRAAIVVEIIDAHTVIIDGDVKRRKANVAHLEPHVEKFDIPKKASTAEVRKLLEEKGLIFERKKGNYTKKERKGGDRPKKGQNKKAGKPAKKKAKKKPEAEIVEESLAKV